MKITTSNSYIGTASSYATLTASYAGNITGAIRARNLQGITLDIHYLPGATNQYVEILLEQASSDNVPASAEWSIYPGQIVSPTDNSVYSVPFIVPGNKTSAVGTEIAAGGYADLLTEWVRVSVREKTSAGGTPSSFGTIHIKISLREDI